MSELVPYEIQKGCRLLLFELPGQVLGFPYVGIQKLNWSEIPRKNNECLEISFGKEIARIEGKGIRRLLPILQRDEIFLLRKGTVEDVSIHHIRVEQAVEDVD